MPEMLFNSYVFLFLFMPLVLVGWWVVFRRPVHRLAFLAFSSYVFYAYYEFPRGLELLPLLLVSTTADYVAGAAIARTDHHRRRKLWLIAALSINLGLLCVFKYLGFFEDTANAILGLFGHPNTVPVTHLILPIGISFYTFNSMSYTIDIYRRVVQPAENVLQYAAFVALFPHVIAGPIVRFADIDQQLRNLKTRLTSADASLGLYFLVCGLVKKLVIADNLAPTIDRLWGVHESLGFFVAWIDATAFSLQLYFDFSGYSDMAVGLALLLGFKFPQNFNSPYTARGPSEGFRRWHMTLSRWLRDYLFIPLGGSRGGSILVLRNLFITMILAGLWHGAQGTFALWGVMWGFFLTVEALAGRAGMPRLPTWLARTCFYIAVVVSLVLFRAPDLQAAGSVYAGMLGVHGWQFAQLTQTFAEGAHVPLRFVIEVLALVVFINVAPNTWEFKFKPSRMSAAILGVAFVLCVLLLSQPSPFLYFRF